MADLDDIKSLKARKTVEARFWAKVNVRGPDDCWEWTAQARHNGGYGKMSAGRGIILRAHRLSWNLHHGPIPDGMCICHRCDNPSCCNPAHLFLGTHLENVHDMWAKDRGRAPPVQSGETHPMATIPDSELPAIRVSKETHSALGRKYGVSHQTIRRIRKGISRS